MAYMEGGVRPYGGQDDAALKDLPRPATSGAGGGGGATPATPTAPPAPIPDIPLTPLDAPTADPGTPVTDGLDIGPGRGSDALGGLAPGASSGPDLLKLAKYLPALEAMASSPDATQAARMLVRKLRAAIPYEVAQEALGRKVKR